MKIWVAILLASLPGCRCDADDETAPQAQPSAVEPAATGSEGRTAPKRPACRAVRVVGQVSQGGRRLDRGALLNEAQWMELGPDARLTLAHTETARTLTLHGPARAQACANGAEQLTLARGRVTTARGSARPGAEVLIATPLAVVHYGDAQLEVEAAEDRLSVSAVAGRARVSQIEKEKNDQQVSPEKPLTVEATAEPEARVAACSRAAANAQRVARQLAPGPSSGRRNLLGEHAAEHVRARRQARAACASALAAVAASSDAEMRGRLEARIRSANQTWRAIVAPAK